MTIDRVHATLERLCNLMRVEAREHGAASGLMPVQLEVLHYLSQCNRFSDTVQGVSEFLGQTKGTVSQTLKVLEKRGLILKQADLKDRRLVHHKATTEGMEILAAVIPANFLRKALGSELSDRVGQLTVDLTQLLQAAQRARGAKSFGACKTCRFLEQTDGEHRCGLTGEALSEPDTELICREHCYPSLSQPNDPQNAH